MYLARKGTGYILQLQGLMYWSSYHPNGTYIQTAGTFTIETQALY